jgi:hypothetical protein
LHCRFARQENSSRGTGATWGDTNVDQVLQVIGALLILAAYVAAQFRVLNQETYAYLVLNLVGSAVLAWLAWVDRQWGFLLLEAVWALVSLWSIIQRARGTSGDGIR